MNKKLLDFISVLLISAAAFCFGMVKGIDIAHKDAIKNNLGKYAPDPINGRTYFYWNTTNGMVKEK